MRGGDSHGRFPLTTREEAKRYVKENNINLLVVFEFSGALLEPMLQTWRGMSVDLRKAEHNHAHYQGDVRDVIDLRVYDMIVFVGPNCYQAMRYDNYLGHKIDDGRTYWAVAFVLWCLCMGCMFARAVGLEQPDTVAEDFILAKRLHGCEVVEFRSSTLGDRDDKFVRLTLVNAELPPMPTNGTCPTGELVRRPSHREYPDPPKLIFHTIYHACSL